MTTRGELDGTPQELLARWPSYGPDWERAIALGIDVSLLEENLRLTPSERLVQLDRMTRLWESTRRSEEPADGNPGSPGHPGPTSEPR